MILWKIPWDKVPFVEGIKLKIPKHKFNDRYEASITKQQHQNQNNNSEAFWRDIGISSHSLGTDTCSQAILSLMSREYMVEVGVYFIYRVSHGPVGLKGISQYLGENCCSPNPPLPLILPLQIAKNKFFSLCEAFMSYKTSLTPSLHPSFKLNSSIVGFLKLSWKVSSFRIWN